MLPETSAFYCPRAPDRVRQELSPPISCGAGMPVAPRFEGAILIDINLYRIFADEGACPQVDPAEAKHRLAARGSIVRVVLPA